MLAESAAPQYISTYKRCHHAHLRPETTVAFENIGVVQLVIQPQFMKEVLFVT